MLNNRRRQWHPTPVLLPGKSCGRRNLVGCSPRGRYKSDTTEQLHFHFSLLRIGEGNGNPVQCSCLENPRDRGAWWVSIYGVAQSRTRLKRLSSSSSVLCCLFLCECVHFHSFSFKEQVSFNLMAAVTICSDFGAQGNEVCHCFRCFPIFFP